MSGTAKAKVTKSTGTKGRRKPRIGIGGALGRLAKGKGKKESKSKHPVVTLKRFAKQFVQIAALEAAVKEAKANLSKLKAEIYPDLEAERRIASRQANQHVRSIKFLGEAGLAPMTYTTKNQYIGANLSNDDIADEAYLAILEALAEQRGVDADEIDEDEVIEMLEERFKTATTVTFKEGSLEDQRVLRIIEEHLADDVTVKTVSVPTETFHNESSFKPLERALMQALLDRRVVKHYTPSLRPTSSR